MSEALTVSRALAGAQQTLDALDARVLLCHAMARDPAYLVAHPDAPLAPDEARAFEALVARRGAGEPVAYLTGTREFYGLEFRVTPAVLIPRPETERLVELALERMPPAAAMRVLDLGTGSGCVALSVARHRPHAHVTATDCSLAALEIARGNARALSARNVEFAAGAWFEAIGARQFDLILSNPPYVAAGDPHLDEGDLRFEPHAALVGGCDGLDAIRDIVAGAGRHLAAGGWLLFEHGHDQAPRSRVLLEAAGYAAVGSWKDLSGIARVAGGRLDAAAG